MELQPDARIRALEARHHLRKKPGRERRRCGHGQPPTLAAQEVAHAGELGIEVAQQILGNTKQFGPHGRQGHVAGVAVEEACADRLLELVDCRAERGLRQVDRLAGLAEAEGACDRDEDLELPQGDINRHRG